MAVFLIFDENGSFIDVIDDELESLVSYEESHPRVTFKQSKDYVEELLLEDEEEIDDNLPEW